MLCTVMRGWIFIYCCGRRERFWTCGGFCDYLAIKVLRGFLLVSLSKEQAADGCIGWYYAI